MSRRRKARKTKRGKIGWRNQVRFQVMGDSNQAVNWLNGRWKINNHKFRADVQKMQNLSDKTDIRSMADHLDLFQHIYRDGMRKPIVLRMRQEKREAAGTPSR